MTEVRQPLRVVADKTVGSMLRAKRFAERMTQAEVAEQIGVRQQTIGAWERGERPQSRYYAALTSYLALPNERSLIALLDNEAQSGAAVTRAAPSQHEPSPPDFDPMAVLARSYAERIQDGTPLSTDEIALYRDFIAYFSKQGD